MAVKGNTMFDKALFSAMGLEVHVGYFTTNSTSNPLAAETFMPGWTVTRDGVGDFAVTPDVTPNAVLFAAAFLVASAGTATTEVAQVYTASTAVVDVVYQSAAGTAADTDGKVIGLLIVTQSDNGVPA